MGIMTWNTDGLEHLCCIFLQSYASCMICILPWCIEALQWCRQTRIANLSLQDLAMQSGVQQHIQHVLVAKEGRKMYKPLDAK